RLQPFDLTEATWLPLLRIARAPEPPRQKDLAAAMFVDGSSVVRLLDNLEQAGLIQRKEGETDRRGHTHQPPPPRPAHPPPARDRRAARPPGRPGRTVRQGHRDHDPRARAHQPRARGRRRERRGMSAPLWLLTLITFSGTLAMHIFVPALPEAARDLGSSVGAMQLTMSVYVF